MPKAKARVPLVRQVPATTLLVERHIYLMRGRDVMLDSDLARLYQVETFNLNKAVKRNPGRFPEDFMFRLTAEEHDSLTFQSGISKPTGRGGRRTLPYAFTQEGVAMLSSVLHSPRAIKVNVAIMRAFVQIREIIASRQDIALEVHRLKQEQDKQGLQIRRIFTVIEKLLPPATAPSKRPIGFQRD